MRIVSIVGGVMLSVALVAPVGAQVDLIVNGGFESPAIAGGSFQIFPSIPGWTTTIGGGIEIQNNVAGAPFEGAQLVELDSTSNSGMQQAIATSSGATYELNLAYSPRPGVGIASNGVEVRVNGALVDTIAADGTGLNGTVWTRFTYAVVATGTSTTIELRATGASDAVGGYVDDVHFLTRATAARVPIPTLSEWGLLLLCAAVAVLGGLEATRRRDNVG